MADPFSPRFVDLVRNHTTTTGTGNLVLGAAVNGFTSFADALGTGDQFYYSVTGIDKPAEREVGRGTLMADGTIQRSPVSGTPTNFTTGTKTVALVAAAEWYSKVEAGSAGGMAVAATRGDLAGMPASAGPVMLNEAGREGVFRFVAGDQTRYVPKDPRQGVYVAPTSDPSGASGAWVRSIDGAVNVRWFGVNADFLTDDLPAFDAALTLIARMYGGMTLYIPRGFYFLSSTLNVHVDVQLRGDGGYTDAGTTLRFGKNCNGIVFNHGNTHGDGFGSQGSAEGSTATGLQLWGGNVNIDADGFVTTYGAGDSTQGHGIRIRTTFVRLEDICCAFFGGDGFNVDATSGGAATVQGNANNFQLVSCHSNYNRGCGYYFGGNDANAGKTDMCSAIDNGGCGIRDWSFLGNTHIQPHVRDCGIRDATGSDGPVGTCVYNGAYYYLVSGQEAAASTTAPGSNEAVWRPFAGHPMCRPWVAGRSWALSAPYATNPGNVNARNVFVGCYAEAAQPPVQAGHPSRFVGGLLDEVGFDRDATAVWDTAGPNRLQAPSFRASKANAFLGEDGNADIWTGFATGASGTIRLKKSTQGNSHQIRCDIDNADNVLPFQIDLATAQDPGAFTVSKLYIGDVTNGAFNRRRWQYIGSAADLAGKTLTQGDVFPFTSPVDGGSLGLVCTAGGTGGSTAVLKPFAPIGASSGSGVADGDKGDITVSGGATSWTVDSASPSSGTFTVAGNLRVREGGLTVAAANDQTMFQIAQDNSGSYVYSQIIIPGVGYGEGNIGFAGLPIRFESGGGLRMLINASGVDLPGGLRVAGTQVIGPRAAAVPNASGGTTVDVEARAAINGLLQRLRTHGLIEA